MAQEGRKLLPFSTRNVWCYYHYYVWVWWWCVWKRCFEKFIRTYVFLFVEIMKTGHEVAAQHASLSNKNKYNSFQKWCGGGALSIESNGLVHIINCVAFTFWLLCRKLTVQGSRERASSTEKNYDVIRFIPSNLFVYGLWHSIFHRYRRERVPPPKKIHACVGIKVYNVPSIDKIYYIVHNHH